MPFCPANVVTQNAPASLRGRFSVRESVSTAALSAFCRPTRRMSLRKNAPSAAETLFTSEIAPFAARPVECRHAKRPPHRCGGVFFCPRERIERRAQRPLPSGTVNAVTKNAPRAAWALFTSEIARFAARPGECCHAKRPRTAAGTPFLPLRAPRPPQATPFAARPGERSRAKTPPHSCGDVFLPERVLRLPRTAPLAARPGERCHAKMSPRCCGGVFSPTRAPRLPRTAPLLCRPTRRTSPRKNAPRAAGTFFCPRERRDCRRQRPCPPTRRMSL